MQALLKTAGILILALTLTGCVVQNSVENDSTSGSFVDYDSKLLAKADSGGVVLFFAASWCTSCNVLKNDLARNSANIPSNLTIMRLDYDSSRELRSKYQVSIQHTLVQVDSAGNKIKMWTGGNNLQSILHNIVNVT